ncbi:MAG: DNA helicase UvrD, partial [Candidatus Aminicenantes bacterium]|nr:DNA helicase UvrD [Candidatus Aminicenantes bacterium]
ETGLSSDPPMNWQLSSLDKYTLVSNSDAHSPSKIGREANVFDTELSYQGLIEAIKRKNPDTFLYTVEFFPQEGKYHYDGHRKCGVILSPRESMKHNDICPECKRRLTIGVMHRVGELSDREQGDAPLLKIPYKNLIPLNEIIAQAIEKTAACKSVWDIYFRFIHEFGNEHRILTDVALAELKLLHPERIGYGVERARNGAVKIVPGHDGCFGKINLFEENAFEEETQNQLKLF